MSQQGCKLSLREWAIDSPNKCKPLVPVTKLISESERGQSVSSLSLLPEDEAPLAHLKQSSCRRVGSDQLIPAYSTEPHIHPGYPRSSLPALPPRDSPQPQSKSRKG